MEISSFTLFTIDIYIPLPIEMYSYRLCVCVLVVHVHARVNRRQKQGIENGILIIFREKISLYSIFFIPFLLPSSVDLVMWLVIRAHSSTRPMCTAFKCVYFYIIYVYLQFSILFDSMFQQSFHRYVDYYFG